jgi:Tfp pilus assembly protein PilO
VATLSLSLRVIDGACMAGLVIIALGGSLAATKAIRDKAARIERTNRAVQDLYRENKAAQTALSRLDTALRANRTTLEMLRKGFSGPEPISGFLAELDTLARQAEVKITSVAPGTGVTEEFCTRTPLQFSCQGSFAGLHAMLHRLESTERFVRLSQVIVSRGAAAGSCAMEITCSLYGR